MTNRDLCGKMYIMMKLNFNLIKKYIFTLFLVALSCACFSFAPIFSVSANSKNSVVSTEYFLPTTEMEHQLLTSPIDVYSDDTVTAIVCDKTLFVYYDNEYTIIDNFTAIKQVKKLDEQTLLVSDNGNIYSISLSNQMLKAPLQSSSSEPIGCNYFDVNDDYLVTAFGTTAVIYEKQGGQFVKLTDSDFPVKKDLPIAINSDNQIFFVTDEGLCKCSALDTSINVKISSDIPSIIIADNQFVYYLIQGQKHINKMDVDGSSPSFLAVGELDKDYELGNVISPAGISFKGDNLLITDTNLNTVQEFSVKDNLLEFTGFAIAYDKTAYNRVSSNTLDIEKTNETVAVLDNDKLLLISQNSDNPYARENFDNYLKEDFFNDKMPEALALGEKSVLLSFNHRTASSGYLKLIDIKTRTLSNSISVLGLAVEDVCYQSGNYYILLTESISIGNNKTYVYKLEEGQTELSSPLFSPDGFNALNIAVDVFGNVYLADVYGNIKLYPSNDFSTPIEVGARTGLKKMLTDLGGILYTISDDGLSYYTKGGFENLTLSLPDKVYVINSFGMNFETKSVFFTIKNKEYVCKTDLLDNYSLDEIKISNNDFVTTKNTITEDEFKIVTINENANIYEVLRERDGDGFSYNGRTETRDVYAYICQAKIGDKLSISVLACQDQLVLVNASDHSSPTAINGSLAPQTVFVTTDVNAYYIPIINRIDKGQDEYVANINFALTDNGTAVRIKKGASISPVKTIEFLTREKDGAIVPINYYFANFEINGTTYSGYVPVSFTVPVLSKDFVWSNYSIEIVNKTNVYETESLDGNSILSLSDGQKVRVIAKTNDYVKIAVNVQGNQWIEGFISTNAIQNRPYIAIRNIIIIITISISILGTSLFLILRKKKI